MKKLISLLLALVLCFALVACGDSGPDKQPAIDAYVEVCENYNQLVNLLNENIDAIPEEEIEFYNGCSELLEEYGAKLADENAELTQEELDEMVDVFVEFNTAVLEVLAEQEG